MLRWFETPWLSCDVTVINNFAADKYNLVPMITTQQSLASLITLRQAYSFDGCTVIGEKDL